MNDNNNESSDYMVGVRYCVSLRKREIEQ
jgi:hypothetical protein